MLVYSDLSTMHQPPHTLQALIEMGQSIEEDRRALEAEGSIKIRKIEVDLGRFEVGRNTKHMRYIFTVQICTAPSSPPPQLFF